jgi:ferritin-like metal-binding protein YciE
MLDEAASEAKEPKIREAFEHHREETREQVRRIEGVFESLQKRPRSVDAPVIEGLLEEKRRFLSADPVPAMIDVFNVAAGIKTEHLEIATYEDLLALAALMGAADAAEPLRKNLEEERSALEKLTGFTRDGTLAVSAPRQGQSPPSRH